MWITLFSENVQTLHCTNFMQESNVLYGNMICIDENGLLLFVLCVFDRLIKTAYDAPNKFHHHFLLNRYKPEIGDIRVDQVLEWIITLSVVKIYLGIIKFLLLIFVKVALKRWRLETNFSQDATLMLSSMNLPDGIQIYHHIMMLNLPHPMVAIIGLLESDQVGFNNMSGTLGSRNPTTVNVPSSGLQQQSGNLSGGRFR
ncbi:hypothetical protein CTI12_AA134910 [Artemisia annua]|uniref:RRP4 S1 domain-containing protein n=1 Tax=Artemisia annua TaxID=35608 RepID=A0A2U1PMW0_ARTAN|nr:hypothetical protein CTI12_AA134910 [Artemisia annua]